MAFRFAVVVIDVDTFEPEMIVSIVSDCMYVAGSV